MLSNVIDLIEVMVIDVIEVLVNAMHSGHLGI